MATASKVDGANAADLRKLKAQRSGVRGRVTTILQQDGNACDIDTTLLKLDDYDTRLNELNDQIQSQIDIEEDLTRDVEGSLTIHDSVLEMKAKLLKRGQGRLTGNASQRGDDAASEHSVGARSRAKLPKLEFKPFSGDPLEWQPFWDRFAASVDQNDDIFDIDKFVLLTTLLDEGPSNVIKGLSITAENYAVAVGLLLERYGKPQVVINAHMEALLDIPKASDPNYIRAVYDSVEVHMRGLEAMGKELDGVLLAPVILKKLPNDTKLYLSRQLGDELWDLGKLREALGEEVQARERTPVPTQRNFGGSGAGIPPMGLVASPSTENGNLGQTSTFVTQTQQVTCNFCDLSHKPVECPLTSQQRRNAAIDRKLCFCCLRRDHAARNCRSKWSCRTCNRKSHHTSLCEWYRGQAQNAGLSKTKNGGAGVVRSTNSEIKKPDRREPEGGQNKGAAHASNTLLSFGNKAILMKTARARASAAHSARPIETGLVFDDASQYTYITRSAAKRLNAKPQEQIGLQCARFRARAPEESTNDVVQVTIHCRDGIKRSIEAVVVDIIAPTMYRYRLAQDEPELLTLDLADPECIHESAFEIDILIGGAHYYDFVDGPIRRLSGGLVAASTRLGWVLTGPASKTYSDIRPVHSFFIHANLERQVERLWELDAMGVTAKEITPHQVLQSFESTVQFHNNRYWVRFPWIPDKADRLPSNRELALVRFRSLQRKLRRDEPLARKYADIIEDQLKRGFIEKVDDESNAQGVLHYIPHHPVVKGDSRTTKVRIVYDASAKTMGGISLNEAQHEGPKMIGDLFQILVRFRLAKLALTADIEKAFLQVGLQSIDRDCTRFFWSDDPYGFRVQVYRFVRVCFGIISSPFLLNATVNHHLKRNNSDVAQVILASTYVDNCIVSVDNLESAREFYITAKTLFTEAGMNLREWCCNDRDFLASIPESDRVDETLVKVLGLMWDTRADSLRISYRAQVVAPVTKRTVLHSVSSVFDPLGFVSPITVKGKIFMQRLWQENLGWDTEVSSELRSEWAQIEEDLREVDSVRVPRWIQTSTKTKVELHAFADASPEAYCAVVYAKPIQESQSEAFLLAAKTRVAPIKQKQTVPRLELLAVLVTAKLCRAIVESLAGAISTITIWSDSTIALCWIRQGVGNKDVFVRNRVKEIRELGARFRYVSSKDNPADLATRSSRVGSITDNHLWWHGPSWLTSDFAEIDASEPDLSGSAFLIDADPPIKEVPVNQAKAEPAPPFDLLLSRFSSLSRLHRLTAVCLLAVEKFHARPSHIVTCLRKAKAIWDRWVQKTALSDCYEAVEKKQKGDGVIRNLGLFLDDQWVLRCRGRMAYSCLAENAKHPVLIPKKHDYTTLVIRRAHASVLHQGVPYTVAEVRQEYWVPQCKQAVKVQLRRCVTCRRYDATAFRPPPAAPIPDFRVTVHPPFSFVGVDFAGPIPCRDAKVWICLFTCAATRALHLELVDSQSTAEFIQTLRKFIARRGTPTRMISDNAQTFKLAQHVLERAWQGVVESQEVGRFVSDRKIHWQFNVERAPWWGGFFERMVGLVKRCLRKCVGQRLLRRSELEVQLYEIEAILNNRPLTFVGDDVGTKPLTPSDALGMRSPLNFPIQTCGAAETDYVPVETSVDAAIKRIAATQQCLASFWGRWKREYLVQLREFHYPKRAESHIAPSVGEVVLIKDDTPRNQWRIGIIDSLIQGKDGYIRAAVVRSSRTVLQRPIQLLIPLEIRSNVRATVNAEPVSATSGEERINSPPSTTNVAATSGEERINSPPNITNVGATSGEERINSPPNTTPMLAQPRTGTVKRKAAVDARAKIQSLAREDI